MSRRRLAIVAGVLAIIAFAIVVRSVARKCRPGDKPVTVGGVVMLTGCAAEIRR